MTVNNAGVGELTDIMLTDTLPPLVNFVSVNTSQGSCREAGGVVDCGLGALASGGSATITIVVQPTTTGTISNSVAVSANEPDDNPNNNTDSEDTTVNPVLCDGRSRPALARRGTTGLLASTE